MEYQRLKHTFEPVFDSESKILILGSFPSVKSREEKKTMLLLNHVAVWDVIASCSIQGSSDTSIKDVVVNDFSKILEK